MTCWDSIWTNARMATMAEVESDPYGVVDDGTLVVAGGRIAWIGLTEKFEANRFRDTPTHDLKGAWITPGLIDCHTHIVYGGNRAAEFELRLNGATYAEIAHAGGGIISTVEATRKASHDELLEQALPRVDHLAREGVTTLEIKSGYGLNTAVERRMLQAARKISEYMPVDIVTTLLGAHALPPEFTDNPDGYIDLVCQEMIPQVAAAGEADAVDAFCETIGFTRDQTERVFQAAHHHDLSVKLHAEQLSDLGGAELVAAYGGLSADHLEYVAEAGVRSMAAAGTVAVLLPGAFYCLRETRPPPIDLFREYGVGMALATDSNPGSSPVASLLLMLNMACTLFRMTPAEALAGVTREAARALGRQDSIGTLETDKKADFVVWGIERPGELAYPIGFNPCRAVIRNGVLVSGQV
ncbi:MAG: imidazolonepropionase [Rhodospirillaceae bacterium]|nr:imidazolonepropionase [Rhodospirillaceae bacterium]